MRNWLKSLRGAPQQPAYLRPYPTLPEEAIERRSRSAEQMRREGVPFNQYLPVIETGATARRLTAKEIAIRALALLAVAMKGASTPDAEWRGYVDHFGLDGAFTPEEAAFMADPSPSQQARLQFSWRFEGVVVLFWAIGQIKTLRRPDGPGDSDLVWNPVRTATRDSFIAASTLRDIGEILDQADLTYCYRWALVDFSVGGKPAPSWLSDDVAMERHQAFNWLVQQDAPEWDDVSLDT